MPSLCLRLSSESEAISFCTPLLVLGSECRQSLASAPLRQRERERDFKSLSVTVHTNSPFPTSYFHDDDEADFLMFASLAQVSYGRSAGT